MLKRKIHLAYSSQSSLPLINYIANYKRFTYDCCVEPNWEIRIKGEKKEEKRTYSGIGFRCFSDIQFCWKTVLFCANCNWRRRRRRRSRSSWECEGRRSVRREKGLEEVNMRGERWEFKGIEFEGCFSVGISTKKQGVWRGRRVEKKETCEGSSAQLHCLSALSRQTQHRDCCSDKR